VSAAPVAPAPVVFVPVGVVAFAGSRSGSPFGVPAAVAAVVALDLPVAVGCQRGVDSVVRSGVPKLSLAVFRASEPQWSALPVRARFAARTRACVSSADCLLAFAPASGVLGRGTALAVRTAVDRGLPVFVASPVCPVFPVDSSWVAATFSGVSGWACGPSQTALF